MNKRRVHIHMKLTDRHVLHIIKDAIDPATNSARLTLNDISKAAGCHRNTAYHSVNRLEAGGYITRLYIGGKSITKFKVCCNEQP